jgi:alpha-glucosidase
MVLVLSMRGTPFLYAGEELGLEDAAMTPDRVMDPGGRDGCRTPIPWTREPGHGWSSEPWLPFANGATESSVEAQRRMSGSMLRFTRRMLELRRRHRALRGGALEGLHVDGEVLIFDRILQGERFRVMVNFSNAECEVSSWGGETVLRSSSRVDSNVLDPGEAVVLDASMGPT